MNSTPPPPAFTLWLEFEQYAGGYPRPGDDPTCDFCNAIVRMDGKACGSNVWTFGFIEYTRRHDEATDQPKSEPGRFLLPPDLLVGKLARALIEEAVAFLLGQYAPSPTQWQWHDEEHAA
ncbi:MAG: hypothetical protein JNM58_07230 [Xanthomonadaceae bacterium]|nr:hypothetical protein [Xanthomonadaceae bacterium]